MDISPFYWPAGFYLLTFWPRDSLRMKQRDRMALKTRNIVTEEVARPLPPLSPYFPSPPQAIIRSGRGKLFLLPRLESSSSRSYRSIDVCLPFAMGFLPSVSLFCFCFPVSRRRENRDEKIQLKIDHPSGSSSNLNRQKKNLFNLFICF